MNQKVKEELKQEFVQKLYGEFSTYREHLLSENPTDLIAEAYKIETFSPLIALIGYVAGLKHHQASDILENMPLLPVAMVINGMLPV